MFVLSKDWDYSVILISDFGMWILDLAKINRSDDSLKENINQHFKIQNLFTPSLKLTYNFSKL